MTRRFVFVLVLALLVGVLAACSGGSTGTGDGTTGETPTLDGATLLEARCDGVCHDLERVDAKELDFANWLPILDKMIGKGAKLTPEEKTVLADFLATK